MFSKRTHWDVPTNRLTLERESLRRDGVQFIDLTETNPTQAGLEYPSELPNVLAAAARAPYRPDARGLRSARNALASMLSEGGAEVDPDDLLLTASTSEAYSFLFKLLADPGDRIVTTTPAYPLLDHITQLEALSVDCAAMTLQAHRWHIDAGELVSICQPTTRAAVIIHPNNPTGSYVSHTEQDDIATICAGKEMALISDEVFYEFAIAPRSDRAARAAERLDVLTFSLGGLSKSAALPHWKLAWIEVGGPEEIKRSALKNLELIADTFLSVATPVQEALPELIALSAGMREQIMRRISRNLELLTSEFENLSFATALKPEGGWSACIRLPRTGSDERLLLDLLHEEKVIAQPGYFFDFETEGFVVISLLCRPDLFEEGVRRLALFSARRLS